MARKNPVPEREIRIGRALADLRRKHLATRTGMAQRLGVSSDQLASYEFGRVPLPWAVGYNFCRHFGIAYRVLATGDGALVVEKPFEVPDEFLLPFGSRPKFSTVFDELIYPLLEGKKPSPIIYRHLKSLAESKKLLAEIEHISAQRVDTSDKEKVRLRIQEIVDKHISRTVASGLLSDLAEITSEKEREAVQAFLNSIRRGSSR